MDICFIAKLDGSLEGDDDDGLVCELKFNKELEPPKQLIFSADEHLRGLSNDDKGGGRGEEHCLEEANESEKEEREGNDAVDDVGLFIDTAGFDWE